MRHFTSDPVPKDKILEILYIARYAASGDNGQPVQWLVVHEQELVKKIAGLTIEWMKSLLNTAHPMSGYASKRARPARGTEMRLRHDVRPPAVRGLRYPPVQTGCGDVAIIPCSASCPSTIPNHDCGPAQIITILLREF